MFHKAGNHSSTAPQRLLQAASGEHFLMSVIHQLVRIWQSLLSALRSLFFATVLCHVRDSCVCCLRWFHSKWHQPMGKTTALQTNGSLFQHLHGRFSSTEISLGTTDSQSFQSRHAEVKVRGMPFLLRADSSAVKSPSKENTLKSMPLEMTSSEKTHSANRDGRCKAVQEAAPSCLSQHSPTVFAQ